MAEIPLEVDFRGVAPVYQRIAAEAAAMHAAGVSFKAIGEHFRVADHTVARAVRWFRREH